MNPTDHIRDRWEQVYRDRGLRDYGVLLEYFLQAPEIILARIDSGQLLPLDIDGELPPCAGARLRDEMLDRFERHCDL